MGERILRLFQDSGLQYESHLNADDKVYITERDGDVNVNVVLLEEIVVIDEPEPEPEPEPEEIVEMVSNLKPKKTTAKKGAKK